MRRWELAADGSAKFWEVSKDGASVMVRFGRLGSNGQTKTKDLASEVAATAHVDKLVAEKEKKGYREVTAEVPATEQDKLPVPQRDETTFTIPSSWRRFIHARRDRGSRRAFTVSDKDAEQAEQFVHTHRQTIDTVLADPQSEPALAAAARAYLGGAAEPCGAAVIVTIVASSLGWRATCGVFAHQWVARHGVVFAARATAELSTVLVSWTRTGPGNQGDRHVRYRGNDGSWGGWAGGPVAELVRSALAAAEDDDYDEAVRALESCRSDAFQQMVTCYLVPTQRQWVDEFCATGTFTGQLLQCWWMALCAVGSADQLAMLPHTEWLARSAGYLYTVVEGVGPQAAPTLATLLDSNRIDTDGRKLLLNVLSVLPTDEAFMGLLERAGQKHVHPALISATRRYPVRALRLLTQAAATHNTAAAQLLHAHLLAHPELIDAELPDGLRRDVEKAVAANVRVAETPVEALPELLVRPPWTVKRAPVKPIVVEGLEPPAERSVVWKPGEREEWAASRGTGYHWVNNKVADWEATVSVYRSGNLSPYIQRELFLKGPEQLLRPLVAEFRPTTWAAEDWAKPVLARFECDALPFALGLACGNPASNAGLLLPFVDAEVARLMADWFVRLKSARVAAIDWFTRHAAAAVRFLVPAALGKPGTQRRNAEAALRLVISQTTVDDVLAEAAGYGPDARRAIETLASTDPLEIFPAKVPTIGSWAELGLLPQILLRDRRSALPRESTGHLLTMLTMSRPEDMYPGVAIVKELCDARSLAEFAWALFQQWQAGGAVSKDSWALTALGWLGDDETVRRLSPVIRAWPGEGGHAKAVAGLDVLSTIGSDIALTHLSGIAQKVKFTALKQRAQEKIAVVAAELGLSSEQLADRLVPTFGLDEAATLEIDYGSRRFVVGFDEQLKPFVVDENGKRRKDLPKPGAHDDQELAPAEHSRFAAMKKDVRTVAADQIRRLEAAMVMQRRLTTTEFHTLLAGHPLLWHIVRRLVWITDGGQGFRLAEDRTLADVNDDVFTLPKDANVHIAHPLQLGDALDAWAEVFADYEILQPFPQLGRPVHTLTQDERDSTALKRFEGATVPVGRLLGMAKRGWRRGVPQDAGIEGWILRPVPGGGSVVIYLDPGIAVGDVTWSPEQKLSDIWLSDRDEADWMPRGSRTFGELDPVTASELLAELTELTN